MGYLIRDSVAVVVRAAPGACYQRLRESQDVGRWWPGVTSALEGPSPWEPGTKLSLRAKLGRPAWSAEVKELVPDRLIEVYYVGGDLRGAESWEFEPVGSGARLVHTWRGVESPFFGRLLGARLHRLVFEQALLGLARAAGSE